MGTDNQGASSLIEPKGKQGNCPLCEQQNQCALSLNESGPCWCEAINLESRTSDIDLALDKLQEGIVESDRLTKQALEQTETCLCLACLNKISTLIREA